MNDTTGVVYPTINIDGRTLVVRCSLYAEYCLSRAGLTLAACLTILTSLKRTGVQDAHAIDSAMEMFAACVAENYQDEPAPNAAQWARKVSRFDDWPEIWKQMCTAIDGALSKRLLAATPPAPPPAEAPALTN